MRANINPAFRRNINKSSEQLVGVVLALRVISGLILFAIGKGLRFQTDTDEPIDTLQADHLKAYGYVRDISPNIDGLAEEGIFFAYAVAQWPETAPSFASMLTSTYGHYDRASTGNCFKARRFHYLEIP